MPHGTGISSPLPQYPSSLLDQQSSLQRARQRHSLQHAIGLGSGGIPIRLAAALSREREFDTS